MANYLRLGLSRLIEPEYLGLKGGIYGDPVEDRFGVLFAKKRDDNNQIAKYTDNHGRIVDTKYRYLVDHSTNELYILHDPLPLVSKFIVIVLINPFAVAGSLIYNTALPVGRIVQLAIHIFKEGVKDQAEFDELTGKLFEEIKHDMKWLGKTVQYGLAMQAAGIYALNPLNDHDDRFAMQVVIDRIEFKWNREVDFRDACLTKVMRAGKQIIKSLEKETENNPLAELIDVASKIAVKELFNRAFYLMICFQSRGYRWASVDKSGRLPKFIDVREFDSYDVYEEGRIERIIRLLRERNSRDLLQRLNDQVSQ